MDINENVLNTNQVDISSYSEQNISIPILDPLIENYILKVFPLNNEINYQSIRFDNVFMSGVLNNDFELNILDILLLVDIILYNQNFLEEGDLNNDYGINILDIAILINWILE